MDKFMRTLYFTISISLLVVAVQACYVEPMGYGHMYGLIDLYEGVALLAGSIGFAFASRERR